MFSVTVEGAARRCYEVTRGRSRHAPTIAGEPHRPRRTRSQAPTSCPRRAGADDDGGPSVGRDVDASRSSWPRWLSRRLGAAYLSCSEREIDRPIAVGAIGVVRLPVRYNKNGALMRQASDASISIGWSWTRCASRIANKSDADEARLLYLARRAATAAPTPGLPVAPARAQPVLHARIGDAVRPSGCGDAGARTTVG